MKTLKQRLASNAHESWARWTSHLLNQCQTNGDGSLTIPASSVLRWKRQIATPFQELSPEEKASDEREAELIMQIINA